jgi:thymidine kinase
MSLTLIIGCMFSGKTTKILSLADEYRKQGKKIMGINFNKNSRYGNNKIITHDKNTYNFDVEVSVSHLNNIILDEFYSMYHYADILIIDELQFYPDAYNFITDSINKDHKTIICSGLNGDFNKKPFEQIHRLIPEADNICYLNAKCKCGKTASFSKRIVESVEQMLIGSSEAYIPTCRECHNK